MKITSENAREFKPHRFSAEASTLQIKPGEWPNQLETDLGNKMPFIEDKSKVIDGELYWVEYRQVNGCLSLLVYND